MVLVLLRRVRPNHDVTAGVYAEVTLGPRPHLVQVERVLDPPGQRGIEFTIAVDGALGIGSHGALYQNCVTRKSAGQGVSAPRATGRAGSRIHSLHDPAYSRAPASP